MAYLTKDQINGVIDDTEDLLDNNKFGEFYKYLYKVFSGSKGPLRVGEFTDFLLNAGVDPLEYLDYVPLNYLFGSQTTSIISIPTNIKTIKTGAFQGSAIKDVAFEGDGLETIDSFAFCYCNNLTSLNLPASLKVINNYAFIGSGLTELHIPATIEKIGENIIASTKCKPIFLGTAEQWELVEKPTDTNDRLIAKIEIRG